MAKITGAEGADVLSGRPDESNDISGLGGADTLTGGNLSDSIDGGDGDDLILSGGGAGNVLVGGSGDDRLIGAADFEGMITYNLLDGGVGDDSLVGGIGDTLIGGDGADTIEAAYRADVRGGDGNDVIDVGLYQSTIDGGAGVDTLIATEQLSSAKISNVEILEVDGYLAATVAELNQFTKIRSADPDSIFSLGVSGSIDLSGKLGSSAVEISTGAASAKIITGEGNDVLSGSYGGEYWLDGRGGNDTLQGYDSNCTLIGGAGDDEINSTSDTFVIDGGAGDDVVILSAKVESGVIAGGAGNDLLIASGDITKAEISGIETLATDSPLTATAAQFEAFQKICSVNFKGYADLLLSDAGALDIAQELGDADASITGSSGDDAITSGAGDDTIVGGEGNDTIHGGAGADLLIVAYGSDQVYGDAGDDIIQLDRFDGNAVDGGAGQDTLAVNESFQDVPVDLSQATVTDVEILRVNTGVISATAAQFDSFDSIICDFSRVELRVVGGGEVDLSDELGGKAVQVVGSAADDVIRSGVGNDTIIGGKGDDRIEGWVGKDTLLGGDGSDTLYGGEGVDRLDGGKGDDLYIVDDLADRIEDTGGAGVDTVVSSVSYRLGGAVENLELSGRADLDGTGTGGENFLSGNSGDNRLDGGKGADSLRGGGGDDVFVFANRPTKSGFETVLDFGRGGDQFELHRDVFDGLPKGAFKESAFKDLATGEADANDRIIYDSATGKLYFDKDGSGEGKAVLFAELKGSPAISWEDFLIV